MLESKMDAQIGANLTFVVNQGKELGFIVIDGRYTAGMHAFEIVGNGNFKGFSSTKVHVGYYNRVLN